MDSSHYNVSRNLIGLIVGAVILTGCGLRNSPASPSQSSRCPAGPAVSLPDSGWPCPPAQAIREIDADVTLAFIDDPTVGISVCHAAAGSFELTRLQERAYQTLWLIKRLEFDVPLPWTNNTLWQWFIGNVHEIRFLQTTVASCCAAGHVMTLPVTNASGAGSGFPTDVFGYVHEARHAEKPHTCNAYDMTVSEMGAFGVQYYLGMWIADHVIAPALTPEERSYGRWSATLLIAPGGAFCTECGGL